MDTLVPDLIVDDFTSTHVAQMTSYLAVAGLRLALLLNLTRAELRWKRVVR